MLEVWNPQPLAQGENNYPTHPQPLNRMFPVHRTRPLWPLAHDARGLGNDEWALVGVALRLPYAAATMNDTQAFGANSGLCPLRWHGSSELFAPLLLLFHFSKGSGGAGV